MSLELVNKVTTKDASGYDQTAYELVTSTVPLKTTNGTQNRTNTRDLTSRSDRELTSRSDRELTSRSDRELTSRSDRDLNSMSSSEKTSSSKSHIAFTLSFKITIANRTPFNPSHNC